MEKSISNKIVEVNCVSHIYADRTAVEICGHRFEVFEGERVAVLGPNGCGKSTLLKHILGLLKPQKGEVLVLGEDPAKDFKKIREWVGVVMQNVEEQILGPTVYDDIVFSLRNYGWPKKEMDDRANEILRDLKIEHLSKKIVHYLSGGEKRKVAIAGALALNPKLLVLDEPFENLDYKSAHEIADYLNNLSKTKKTAIVYAVHDMHMVPKITDRVYLMKPGGHIGDHGKTEEVLKRADLESYNLERPHL
jgi:cobalt/nickel transport system ATP-binding protein